MKKILICVLSLSLLLASLTGCGLLDKFIIPEEQVYTFGRFSITLPSDFVSEQRSLIGGSTEVFYSNDYSIKVQKYSFDSITPKDGYDFPALAQFASDMLGLGEEPLLVLNDKGVLGYDYTDENGNNAQLLVFLESDDAYWFISFFSSTVDYETAKVEYLKWIDTISFGE